MQFDATVSQGWQCHPVNAASQLLRPEVVVADDSTVDKTLYKELVKTPVYDPKRCNITPNEEDKWTFDWRAVAREVKEAWDVIKDGYQVTKPYLGGWGASDALVMAAEDRTSRALSTLGPEEVAMLRAVLRLVPDDDPRLVTERLRLLYQNTQPLPDPHQRPNFTGYWIDRSATEEPVEFAPAPRPNLRLRCEESPLHVEPEEDVKSNPTPSRKSK